MQQNPNGLKSSIRRISPKINIPVDFFVIIAALTTNYTVQIKYALHYFNVPYAFVIQKKDRGCTVWQWPRSFFIGCFILPG